MFLLCGFMMMFMFFILVVLVVLGVVLVVLSQCQQFGLVGELVLVKVYQVVVVGLEWGSYQVLCGGMQFVCFGIKSFVLFDQLVDFIVIVSCMCMLVSGIVMDGEQ